jgi:MurNAc alpha-1-phosphate uridylyltransferase
MCRLMSVAGKSPSTAMVLAAGLGTRMRPLTNDRPKALIEVGGKALIDHVLDRLAQAGVSRAVVNVHAFAEQVEAHLAGRSDLEILVSDERGQLLETGGALARAAPLLGEAPILVVNIDTLWTDEALIARLARAWEGASMNALLAVIPLEQTLGFDGPGDFFIDGGRLSHRGQQPRAPLAYMGVHMMDPGLARGWPLAPHGLIGHWLEWAKVGALHGMVAPGQWMHVGDPAALAAAEAALSPNASPPPLGERDPQGVEGVGSP